MCGEGRELCKEVGAGNIKLQKGNKGNKLDKSVSLKHDTSHNILLYTLEIFQTFKLTRRQCL